MTSQEFKEAIEALSWCEEQGWTGLGAFYRDLLNDADRRGKLPPEAFPVDEPEPEEARSEDEDDR